MGLCLSSRCGNGAEKRSPTKKKRSLGGEKKGKGCPMTPTKSNRTENELLVTSRNNGRKGDIVFSADYLKTTTFVRLQ